MPQQKWNLGDIRPPERQTRTGGSAASTRKRPAADIRARAERPLPEERTDSAYEQREETAAVRGSSHRGRSERKRGKLFWGGAVIVLVAIGFLTTLILRGAELTIYPKFKDVAVQAAFTAYKQPAVDTLGYELMTLEETGERTVSATDSQKAEERATGEITIYNAHTTGVQRLIKNTRFESSDGHIFRIQESVDIPGYTQKGNDKVPGSVTAKVFADGAGEAYNVAPGKFTIPGLKGDPQFDTIYAESKAPMQGGFIGERLIVSPEELAKAQEAIRGELKEKLFSRAQSERPAGFELFVSAVRVRFESLPSVDAGDKQATIREKAILEAPIFSEGDFARYLAQNTIAEYKGEAVRIENPKSLTFAYTAATSTPAAIENPINFTLAGNARIVWQYDKNKLRDDVAGAPKDKVPEILLSYQPAIERATTIMRPFWKRSFPRDPAEIKIVEVIGSPSE